MAGSSSMHYKLLTTTVLMAVTGTISGCNSTDPLYAQSPWGPTHARRSYPEYSAPWGRPIEPSDYAGSTPAAVRTEALTLETVQPTRRQNFNLEVDLGPLPPAQGAATIAPSEPSFLAERAPAGFADPSQAADVAVASGPANPPGVFTPSQRASSYAGSWKANVRGTSCKVQLSSVPSLDLYKASTQGCAEEVLRGVNGWTFRENQVILFSRGQLVARLSGAEAALEGSLNGSDSEIRMSR
jgi:hypothetical protein